jgi:peptidoglycan/xylan/chitin deacetylase (PgdA/CDA1 family)
MIALFLVSLTMAGPMRVQGAPKVAPTTTEVVRSNDFPKRYAGKTIMNPPKGFSEKVLALTFDDGPSPFTTPKILDSLKKRKLRATFFLVGQMIQRREKIVQRIIAEGHDVGNHTNSHPMWPNPAKAEQELDLPAKRIKDAIGFTPHVFRPPYGNLKASTTALARKRMMPIIYWTGTGSDTATHDPARVAKSAIASIRPGAIILMHDIQPHTMRAVPTILDAMVKKGYELVTVTELLKKYEAYEIAHPKPIKPLTPAKPAKGKVVASKPPIARAKQSATAGKA